MSDHRLRDLWLSEMWAPVKEWHSTRDEREDAEARNSLLSPSPDVSTAVDETPVDNGPECGRRTAS